MECPACYYHLLRSNSDLSLCSLRLGCVKISVFIPCRPCPQNTHGSFCSFLGIIEEYFGSIESLNELCACLASSWKPGHIGALLPRGAASRATASTMMFSASSVLRSRFRGPTKFLCPVKKDICPMIVANMSIADTHYQYPISTFLFQEIE